ncbi:hypothetical protein [Microbacterium sp. NPDC087591]|uniref:hypothetical protein n=1 Tax=Microbacterium sp. NPDC087591 TaxID=3364192 RepID=UPI00380DA401
MMLDVDVRLDQTRMVPVPRTHTDAAARQAWAEDIAGQWGRLHELADERVRWMTAGLEALATVAAGESGDLIVIFDPLSQAIAPVRLAIVEGEPTRAEQLSFLQPVAPLSGRLRLTPPTVFGIGCSSAFPTAQPGVAELRWLFIAGGCTLTAIASPVGQSAALSVGVTVEDLLTALSVGDRVLSRSPDFDPEALVRVDETAQPRWSA